MEDILKNKRYCFRGLLVEFVHFYCAMLRRARLCHSWAYTLLPD